VCGVLPRKVCYLIAVCPAFYIGGRPDEAPQVARDAIAVGAKAIWFQYGVINEDAIRLADEAGLDVVVDRCIKVETARFSGGLALGGVNTGIITARRR
jgi:hypothetical protein